MLRLLVISVIKIIKVYYFYSGHINFVQREGSVQTKKALWMRPISYKAPQVISLYMWESSHLTDDSWISGLIRISFDYLLIY